MPFKKRFEFWLDYDKPEQLAIAEKIEAMKERRQFAPNVRNGLLLVEDLRAGNVEVLLQLFPDIREKLSVPPPPSPEVSQNNRLAAVLEQLASTLKSNKQHDNKLLPATVPANLGPGLEMEPLPEVKVRTTKTTSNQSSQNFLNSLMSLQS